MGEHAHAHEHGQDTGHGPEHGHAHLHPDSYYWKIWGFLLVLLFVSVLGPELGIKIVTLITAFGVAVVKAFVVVKYFMHLDVEKPMVWYMLTTSVIFLVMFFAGVSPDVMNHQGSRWENLAAKQTVERLMAAGPAGAEHGSHAEGGDHGGAQPTEAPAHGEGH